MTIASTAIKSSLYAREQNTAFFLAQEGIEAVVAIRNEYGLRHVANPAVPAVPAGSWVSNANVTGCSDLTQGCGLHFIDTDVTDNPRITCTTAATNPCRLYYNASAVRAVYSHTAAGVAPSKYSRQIFITPSAPGWEVTSLVTWQPNGTVPVKTVRLTTFLYNIYNIN